jgi:hypothetical protein
LLAIVVGAGSSCDDRGRESALTGDQSGRLFFPGEEFELFIATKLDLEGEGAEAWAFEEEDSHWLATAAYALGAERIGILTG